MKTGFFVLIFTALLSGPAAAGTACLKPAEITPQMDLPALFSSLETCFREKNYHDASFLYGVGKAYGVYDTLRVKDETAHPAASDALTQVFVTIGDGHDDEKTAFRETMLDTLIRTTDRRLEFCRFLLKLGRPGYTPLYMVTKGNDPAIPQTLPAALVDDFNPGQAWLKAIHESWMCPIDGL